MKWNQTISGLVIATLAATAPCGELAPAAHFGRIAEKMARELPRDHISKMQVDDSISARTWTNYLASLDFDRVLFTANDIRDFEPHIRSLDDEIKEGRLDFAYFVYSRFKERVRERYAATAALLARGFDVEKEEYYHWKRRDCPWPADSKEQDEVWQLRIKNEYVREQVARQMATNSAPPAATNAVESSATNAPPVRPKTVEETILNRHKQALTVFEDNDAEWVLQKFLSSFARAYDPHSDYMAPSTAEDFEIEMKLSLCGIGAVLMPEDGAAKILRLIPGGPAERDKRPVRLQPGDKIIAVAQGDDPPVDILHWPLNKAVGIIRGEKGTRVVLTAIPASDPTETMTKKVDLVRDEVRLEDQEARLRVEDVKGAGDAAVKLGVLSVPAFYANMKVRSKQSPDFKSVSADVEELLKQAASQDLKGLVLDLRNNGGGSLLEAIRMTGLFIRVGPVVMVMESGGTTVLPDRDPNVAFARPMVVLVNRLSASASEILAAALQDYGRAIVMGDTKTHGKGTVQSIKPIDADPRFGSLKTTSSLFFRITGRSTQLDGVRSDIVFPSPFDFMELGEDSLPNPLRAQPITPASYHTVHNLGDTAAELKRLSSERCASDQRYIAYGRVLDRVREMNESARLPLRLEDRMALAKTEKELASLQENAAPDEAGEGSQPGNEGAADPVAEEALRVLADLVRLCPEMESSILEARTSLDLSDMLQNWLRRNTM
jgi:carboxyl-terminal processing protease